MRKISVFNNVTLDGYFTGPAGDLNWAYQNSDPDLDAFISSNAQGGGTLLFGRKTYEMMAQYWPTPAAAESNPEVAAGMNRMTKLVFSRTLQEAGWNNTRLFKGDLVNEVQKLKKENGEGITILGSGTIVAQLAQEGLIDEVQLVINPVILGRGRTMFEGMQPPLNMRLIQSRSFSSKVWLCYALR